MNDGNSGGIRIVAVLGTARPGNFTSKALALVIDEIEKQEDIGVDLIDPATMNLPLPGSSPDSADTKSIQEIVSKSTGVVWCGEIVAGILIWTRTPNPGPAIYMEGSHERRK